MRQYRYFIISRTVAAVVRAVGPVSDVIVWLTSNLQSKFVDKLV